jgi:predicted DNA-binding mobile mystery protein A
MSAAQLGRRLGVTQSAASYYERSEASDTINLGTLRKVAAALDCELVYALVPRDSLEEVRARRAREVAERRIAAVSESMALEEQDISAEARAKQVQELTQSLLADWPRTIWDDR